MPHALSDVIDGRGEGRGVIENPYYSQDTHGPYELFPLGDFVLEEGYTLRDCKLA